MTGKNSVSPYNLFFYPDYLMLSRGKNNSLRGSYGTFNFKDCVTIPKNYVEHFVLVVFQGVVDIFCQRQLARGEGRKQNDLPW